MLTRSRRERRRPRSAGGTSSPCQSGPPHQSLQPKNVRPHGHAQRACLSRARQTGFARTLIRGALLRTESVLTSAPQAPQEESSTNGIDASRAHGAEGRRASPKRRDFERGVPTPEGQEETSPSVDADAPALHNSLGAAHLGKRRAEQLGRSVRRWGFHEKKSGNGVTVSKREEHPLPTTEGAHQFVASRSCGGNPRTEATGSNGRPDFQLPRSP
jgi:hypothetical protein